MEPNSPTDDTFECNCEGTQFEGPTCNRGILSTPMIPTLIQNEMSMMFNVSARPSSDIVVGFRGRGLQVQPRQITLNSQQTSGMFQVTGRSAGHYTLQYSLSGAVSNEFESPDSTPVLVSRMRSRDRINRFFRYQRNDPGFVTESCCSARDLMYSECPMTTTSITFRSSCFWSSKGFSHQTSGVVFAEHKDMLLPLAISGIDINYRGGDISSSSSGLSVSDCGFCRENQGKTLTSRLLKSPNCYFYRFDSGDVEDLLRSNSLANTFMDRASSLFPSWFSASVSTAETDAASFSDIDFVVNLVEQGDVAGISTCESIDADNAGLYAVLRYRKSFNVSVGEGSEVNYSPSQTDSNSVCVAISLCEAMESPVYFGLPSDVQPLLRQLPVMAPFNRDDWQFTIEGFSLYSQARQLSIADTYWNGMEYYTPNMLSSDFRMKLRSYINFESQRYITVKMNSEGDLQSHFPTEQVESETCE